MTPQIKTQVLGISLAAATAMGCVAYEKLVKSQPYWFVGLMSMCAFIPFVIISTCVPSLNRTQQIPISKWWLTVFLMSGITGPIWYWITRQKSVLVGAIFEVKYIAILVLCAVLAGSKQVTPYTILGAGLAMASIYFISK